jgi:hypothetical protein
VSRPPWHLAPPSPEARAALTDMAGALAAGPPTPETQAAIAQAEAALAADTDRLVALIREVLGTGAMPVPSVLGGPWRHELLCADCGPVPFTWAGAAIRCPWCAHREAGVALPRLVTARTAADPRPPRRSAP